MKTWEEWHEPGTAFSNPWQDSADGQNLLRDIAKAETNRAAERGDDLDDAEERARFILTVLAWKIDCWRAEFARIGPLSESTKRERLDTVCRRARQLQAAMMNIGLPMSASEYFDDNEIGESELHLGQWLDVLQDDVYLFNAAPPVAMRKTGASNAEAIFIARRASTVLAGHYGGISVALIEKILAVTFPGSDFSYDSVRSMIRDVPPRVVKIRGALRPAD